MSVSNEVLLEKIENLHTNLNEKVDAIIIQTTKTNGRVTVLEALKNKLIGGLILGNLFLGFVLALFLKMF